jgi:outer membrane receptor protein involved in Fe transport
MSRLHLPLPAAIALIASQAVAQTGAFDFDIPAQPLRQAVQAIANQSGLRVSDIAAVDLTQTSAGVRGHMTAQQAMDHALKGSSWMLHIDAAGNARLQPRTSLQRVTITATRTPRFADEVPASVNVLTATDLATKSRQNVYEALRDLEGMQFGYSASVPQQVTPTMRGVGGSFAGQTTQALVDGMPMDSPVSAVLGRGGLNFTPVFDVERVEVVRGPGSVLYGPGVIGGVVNVIPKRWKGEPGAEFMATYGSHSTTNIAAAVGTQGKDFDVRLSALDARSDGFVAIPTPDPFGQVDIGPRDWTDRKLGLIAGWRPLAGHALTLSVQDYATRAASLGGRPNERHNLDGSMATLGYQADISATTALKAHLRTARLKQKFTFDEEDWNGDVGNRALAYAGGRDSDTSGVHIQLDMQPTVGNQLTAGYSYETGDYESYSEPVGDTRSASGAGSTVHAVFVQDEHRIGDLVLTGGLRWDRLAFDADTVNGVPKNGSSSVDNVVTPRLGARYFFGPATSVYASAGTAYLPATNSFKFVQPSTTRVDNPDLKPERSRSVELGVNHAYAIGALRAAVYHTEYRDKITLDTDAASGKRQWQNIALVKVDGVELAYEGRLPGGWQPYANASYVHARDYASSSAPGTQSTRVSPRSLNLGLTYSPADAWSATFNVRTVSSKYFNSLTEAQRSAGYGVADMKLRYRLPLLGQTWEAFAAVNNLTDRRYSEWNVGEYADGRNWTIGLGGRF